jgi:hypothetical protein
MTNEEDKKLNAMLKARMRHRLEEIRWTLEELSTKTAESYSNIRNWVTGDTRVPGTFLVKYTKVVPVNPAWLLTGNGSPAPMEDGAADLMFQLISGIAGMTTQPGVTNDQLRARLFDMVALLDDLEHD